MHYTGEVSELPAFDCASGRAFQGPFFASLGYTSANWRRVKEDLLVLAASGEAELGKDSPYGQKYEHRGTLNVQVYEPDGLEVEFVTASGKNQALVTQRQRLEAGAR